MSYWYSSPLHHTEWSVRKTVEMVAVAAVVGSGEQRGSLVGGSGAAVVGVGEVAVVVAVVSSRLAACLGLALTPAWTHRRRGREGDSEPGRLISQIFYFSNGGGGCRYGGRYPSVCRALGTGH